MNTTEGVEHCKQEMPTFDLKIGGTSVSVEFNVHYVVSSPINKVPDVVKKQQQPPTICIQRKKNPTKLTKQTKNSVK